MNKKIKSISLLLIATILIGIFSGCNNSTNAREEAKQKNEEVARTVTDLQGNKVKVKKSKDLNSIVITSWKGSFGAAVLLGELDKVNGMSNTERYNWLRHAFPKIKEIPDFGSFEEVNVEEILKINPDIVISPAASSGTINKLKEVGLNVLVDGVDTEDKENVLGDMYDEINLVAELTGTESIAKKYFEWADKTLDLVNERVKDIPKSERKRVLPARRELTEVFGNNNTTGYVIELAGGINVSGDITDGTETFYTEVDIEQIVKWNPQYIFSHNFGGNLTKESRETFNNWSNDKRVQDVKAIENKDVYLVPTGITSWNSEVELPLGVMWMASIMYPDKFEDIDIKKYAEDFYIEFLEYKLNEEDWNLIAQQYNGTNNNGLSKEK